MSLVISFRNNYKLPVSFKLHNFPFYNKVRMFLVVSRSHISVGLLQNAVKNMGKAFLKVIQKLCLYEDI